MSKKIIKFLTIIPDAEVPKPSRNYIPEWYKKSKRFNPGENFSIDSNGVANLAIKMCAPFLDSFINGYTAVLWQDILVRKTELGLNLSWRKDDYPDPAVERPSVGGPAEMLPTPAGHAPQHFAWNTIFQIKTPPGYSLLLTHPFNRFDLPFTTLTGIVEADEIVMNNGNIPFFIREDFEGVIPAGTPIFQILPFKRDDWKSEVDESLKREGIKVRFLSLRTSYGWYKREIWKKKNYE
jgi:hypothetical protein